MAFAVYDKIAKKIIKDEDKLKEMKILMRPDGVLVASAVLYGSHQSRWTAYVDVSHRFAALHKVGCG